MAPEATTVLKVKRFTDQQVDFQFVQQKNSRCFPLPSHHQQKTSTLCSCQGKGHCLQIFLLIKSTSGLLQGFGWVFSFLLLKCVLTWTKTYYHSWLKLPIGKIIPFLQPLVLQEKNWLLFLYNIYTIQCEPNTNILTVPPALLFTFLSLTQY